MKAVYSVNFTLSSSETPGERHRSECTKNNLESMESFQTNFRQIENYDLEHLGIEI